jgi:ASC-1-like (ASCH) protein
MPNQPTKKLFVIGWNSNQNCMKDKTEYNYNLMRTKILWIKDEYLTWILCGRKTVEVRVGYSNITRLQPGDQLLLNEVHPYTIRRISRYASFSEMLEHESPNTIAPGAPPDELLAKLKEIYPPEKEALGVTALEIEPALL